VQILDVTGRAVRDANAGSWSPGARRLVWDGRTDHGKRVAPGLYFIRVFLPDATLDRRVVMIH
jgi:flagellar hook assembly protein FlgD